MTKFYKNSDPSSGKPCLHIKEWARCAIMHEILRLNQITTVKLHITSTKDLVTIIVSYSCFCIFNRASWWCNVYWNYTRVQNKQETLWFFILSTQTASRRL